MISKQYLIIVEATNKKCVSSFRFRYEHATLPYGHSLFLRNALRGDGRICGMYQYNHHTIHTHIEVTLSLTNSLDSIAHIHCIIRYL